MPFLLDSLNTKSITLLTTDVKTRKLIGVNMEIIEKAIKNLNIRAISLARRIRAISVILLTSQNAAISLTGSIMATKSVKLQTKYLGTRKTK